MTLKYTADQIRDRESARIGIVGKPNPWWGWTTGSDCMAGQTDILGIRTNRASSTPYEISIAAFRAHFGWNEVPMAEAAAGMLVAEYWPEHDGDPILPVPNHIEYIHSIDRAAGTITTDSANTGPRPGENDPRGFYRKTRALGGNFLFAIVVPAKGEPDSSPYGASPPSALAKRQVKIVAAYLNVWAAKNHPELHPTTSDKDGVNTHAPRYWTLVQTWGRDEGIYGPTFRIDGDPGPRSKQVEAVILKRATTAGK